MFGRKFCFQFIFICLFRGPREWCSGDLGVPLTDFQPTSMINALMKLRDFQDSWGSQRCSWVFRADRGSNRCSHMQGKHPNPCTSSLAPILNRVVGAGEMWLEWMEHLAYKHKDQSLNTGSARTFQTMLGVAKRLKSTTWEAKQNMG